MAECLGPWINHDGSGVPTSIVGKLVTVVGVTAKTQEEIEETSIIHPWQMDWDGYRAWDWSYYGKKSPENPWRYSKIVRYRVHYPRALRDLIKLVEDVPSEMEDA